MPPSPASSRPSLLFDAMQNLRAPDGEEGKSFEMKQYQ